MSAASAARSLADGGILIIALATETGLEATQIEPFSYWLARRTFQSSEFHLMKASVAAGCSRRGCSRKVVGGGQGGAGGVHFSLSIIRRLHLPV